MQALALKYRPKNYNELIGQDTIAKSLTHALNSGRLSHAYLFSGLRGSGKTSSARIFAKALLCEKGPTGNPCEECASCIMANEGRHIDIIEMDAASHRKIDDIRELIEQTKYSPASARFKIFIIDEVHMLTKEASNALLKTLEEPPSYVKFILATTDPLKLPVTVLSRTQHFRFKPIPKNAVVAHLERILNNENIKYQKEALEILARSGSGSLRDTLTLLDQAIIYSGESVSASAVADMLGLLDPDKIDEILKVVLEQDRTKAIKIVKEIENYSAETIIDEIIANLKDEFFPSESDESREKRVKNNFNTLMYERFFRILSEAKGMLGVSADNGFTLSMMIFMMMEAVNLRSIDELIEVSKTINSPSNQSVADGNLSKNLTSVPSPNSQNQAKNLSNSSANLQNSALNSQGNQTPSYELFLEKIYDRDYDLGERFKKCVEFIKFEDDTLHLLSNAKDNDKIALRNASKAIMAVVRKVFGNAATIKMQSGDDIKKNDENLENSANSNLQNSVNSTNSINSANLNSSNSTNSQNSQNSVSNESNKFLNYVKNDNKEEQISKTLRAVKALENTISNGTSNTNDSLVRELDRLFGAHKKISE
ncbi:MULTISPECIES: DNA polymerase III subunit gamma/tau [unclassified Campylobacter]|uniref:DNA polymerase III subunit gamma/tau n=1 Tax=unclassified Campylobacter TaxID=2593542 RepID=UPI0022EA0BF1|nr:MULTISPECIES: DNA polymerase III subunit gamma/tau [unclassified Campylobacter]MDA3056155.1 DNA polymerase III subunit gamma/tau [Campylobacter sp. CN_NA1]MDA3065300.1 DNA polymerase III subunit gamma/tau [Campylobacter sp. CN_NE4]MDA3068125.1 DNA polymerase III subunit gamma/tau [Campylobacter sp. CN_NE3]MDA3082753.1 DNA polymerase III subunit gamma/tau [Campylobacter sp. CN_EL2]MDA3083508.1 DNA polymerase III subunit gamma/tau [Campylobacter sp. CN_NE1]